MTIHHWFVLILAALFAAAAAVTLPRQRYTSALMAFTSVLLIFVVSVSL
jgi:hypothetical protein